MNAYLSIIVPIAPTGALLKILTLEIMNFSSEVLWRHMTSSATLKTAN